MDNCDYSYLYITCKVDTQYKRVLKKMILWTPAKTNNPNRMEGMLKLKRTIWQLFEPK